MTSEVKRVRLHLRKKREGEIRTVVTGDHRPKGGSATGPWSRVWMLCWKWFLNWSVNNEWRVHSKTLFYLNDHSKSNSETRCVHLLIGPVSVCSLFSSLFILLFTACGSILQPGGENASPLLSTRSAVDGPPSSWRRRWGLRSSDPWTVIAGIRNASDSLQLQINHNLLGCEGSSEESAFLCGSCWANQQELRIHLLGVLFELFDDFYMTFTEGVWRWGTFRKTVLQSVRVNEATQQRHQLVGAMQSHSNNANLLNTR